MQILAVLVIATVMRSADSETVLLGSGEGNGEAAAELVENSVIDTVKKTLHLGALHPMNQSDQQRSRDIWNTHVRTHCGSGSALHVAEDAVALVFWKVPLINVPFWSLMLFGIVVLGVSFGAFKFQSDVNQQRIEILLSLFLLSTDIVLDWKTNLFSYLCKGHWQWACWGLFMLFFNPLRAGAAVILEKGSIANAVKAMAYSVVGIFISGYSCVRKGRIDSEFRSLKFEEAIYESIPQFYFQFYVASWQTMQSIVCTTGMRFEDKEQGVAVDTNYWKCERGQEASAYEPEVTQLISMGLSFVMMVYGTAEWCEHHYKKKGLLRPLPAWLFLCLMPLLPRCLGSLDLFHCPPPDSWQGIDPILALGSQNWVCSAFLASPLILLFQNVAGRGLDCSHGLIWAVAYAFVPYLTPIPGIGTLAPDAMRWASTQWLSVYEVTMRWPASPEWPRVWIYYLNVAANVLIVVMSMVQVLTTGSLLQLVAGICFLVSGLGLPAIAIQGGIGQWTEVTAADIKNDFSENESYAMAEGVGPEAGSLQDGATVLDADR